MKKLLLGIVLGVVAFGAPLLMGLSIFQSLGQSTIAFRAPGELAVTVEEPGRYYVWNEHQTIYEGRTYSQSKKLPADVTFSLLDVGRDQFLELQADGSTTVSLGTREMVSVGYYEVQEPGEYVLKIEGLDEPRIFSFGQSVFGDFLSFFGRMMVVVLAAIAAAIGSILLIVFGILELIRKERRPPPTPSA